MSGRRKQGFLSGEAAMKFQTSIVPVCLFVFCCIGLAPAQTVNLTANDSFGVSSFNSAGIWSDGFAPTGWNEYSTVGYLLRTPSVAGNYTFAGASLTIGGGDGGGANPFLTNGQVNLNCLLNKTPSGPIITVKDLILDAGTIRDATMFIIRSIGTPMG
jgi:hypothetical protein